MSVETALPILMFIFLFGFILTGAPVAFVLGGVGILFAVIGYFFNLFSFSDFGFLAPRIFGIVKNFTLLAVPLFIFMGAILEKTGIAEELINCIGEVFSRVRGGLLAALVVVGALLAASTGIVGATVVTMGMLALPPLIKRDYDKALSCGTIAAAGTLGQIIPPSIVLILLADIMNVAVADLFAAALLPGCLLVLFYILYILTVSFFFPSKAGTAETFKVNWFRVVKALFLPVILIILVLGSILGGFASPTESAACGAVGAFLIGVVRGKMTFKVLKESAYQTTYMTSMVFTLLVGAQIFSVVFRGLYGDEVIENLFLGLSGNVHTVMLFTMVSIFIMGFFLDFIEICFIIVPLITPVLVEHFSVNPVWLAILIAVNLQTSFLTPPFGFSLFYLRGTAPPSVTTWDIYKGVFPFVFIQLVVLVVVYLEPNLVLFLPKYLFG